MTRKKEFDNPIRINLMIEQNMIQNIDNISKNTGLSRSKLIRIACKAFLRMIENQIIDDDTEEQIIITLKSLLTDNIPEFSQEQKYTNEEITDIYYNYEQMRSLLSCTWRDLRIAIIDGSIEDLEGSGIIEYIDKKEIIPKENLNNLINDLELDENDSKKLRRFLINIKKSKKDKK